ncbi:glycosyltransferase [Paraclostridium sordellii 8483]|uniref:glycosyltransferase n=1 Tax=Paraclostridium sordellii TaxID=1505 RepID=UPI0002F68724|nr:glycosyltransferase [Paeniclostridium sordellii]TAN67481.1 glycosyltransferase [Paeniclostridium sordellii 8483]
MKKKVFIIVPTLGTGGGEKLVIDLATNIDKSIFDVSIISLFAPRGTIYEKIVMKENINVIYMNKVVGIDFKLIFKLIKLFKEYRPDIVHTHLNVMPYVLPAVIKSRVKSRIHTVHSVADKEAEGILRLVMKFAYKNFNFTPVAICDYVQETISKVYGIKISEIPCIYNGVNSNIFNKNRYTYKNRNKKYINLINIGTLYHVKNQKLIIDAFSEVQKQIPNIRLTILGDGELRTEIESQINSYNLNNKITLKGVVENVADELNNSDIYIMASNYEGLPLSILEAMSCELPIIATKAGGVIDIVENNENGILVDIGSKQQLEVAMKVLCNNEELRTKMGEKSKSLSQKYDIRKVAKDYEKLYMSK